MKLTTRLLSLAVFASLGAVPLHGDPIARSTSPSRQFLIYGVDAQLRGAVSDLAEQVKVNFLSILHESDGWKTPIILNLQFPQANVPDLAKFSLNFSQTGAGLKIQADFVVGPDLRAPEMEREILRAILLERIYRQHFDIAPGTPYVQPPDWLLDGLLAMSPGSDRRPLASAVATLLSTRKSVSLEEFLQQRVDQLDSPARLFYRAQSLALLRCLVQGAEGARPLQHYIDNLARSSNDALADLTSQFANLSSHDMEENWRWHVAALATNRGIDLATFADTERQLSEALRIDEEGKKLALSDLLGAKLTPRRKARLVLMSEQLIVVGLKANPLLRPVVGEYQQIAQLILAGKRNGLEKRLARLDATHGKLVGRMNNVDDYMNWFEATQSKTKSGVFADYLRAAADKDHGSRRRDSISVYLDVLELQMEN